MLTWDTGDCDVELIVVEPSGEICSCFNNYTRSGGHHSRDFSGYGPEEYMLRTAQVGTYLFQCKLKRAPKKTLTEHVQVKLEVTPNFGRASDGWMTITQIAIDQHKDTITTIGNIQFN